MKTHETLAQQEFVARQLRRRQMVVLARLFLFLSVLVLWEACARTGVINAFIFSSPSRIVRCFFSMVLDGSIFLHTGVTILETLVSFFFVTAVGILGAVALWSSKSLAQIWEPFLVLLNSLPKSALAPLLIVWLGANLKSVIVSGISVAIFGTVLNLYTGFCEVDPDKIKLIYTLQGTKRDVLRKVMLPGTVPLLLSVMKVNIGLCLVGVVIGEFIGAREGLGYLIIYGSQVFRLDWVMMSIVLLCMIAMLLYGLLGLIEKRCLRRR